MNKTANPLATISAGREDAALLLEKFASKQALDLKIAELQTQLDEIPAQEAAIAADRSKSPADVRAALTVLRDQASNRRFEQKRLGSDRAKVFTEAAALFPQCRLLVGNYFNGLYQAEQAKAVAAVTPFFIVGASITPESMVAGLPTVSAARTKALNTIERINGESPERTLELLADIIEEFGLHKAQAV
jgi:hypothetical protein